MYIEKVPSEASASGQDKEISSIFPALTLLEHSDIKLQQLLIATVCCVQNTKHYMQCQSHLKSV